MKNTRSADVCADRIDVITNFAVIAIAVIMKVHCISKTVYDNMMLCRENGFYFDDFFLKKLHNLSLSGIVKCVRRAFLYLTSSVLPYPKYL